MKRLFLARTGQDLGNQYLYAYSQEILDEANNRGWIVEKSENELHTRTNTCSRLSNKPGLVVLNGHGSEDAVFGFNDEPVLDSENSHLLAGSVSFMRACGCLSKLGKKAVAAKAKAVIGYRGDFWICKVNEYTATPLQDPSARPVLEASNAAPLKLLHGATVEEAVNASKEKTLKAIFRILTREEPYDSGALKALIGNEISFEGDGNATAV